MQVCLLEPGNFIAGTNIFNAEFIEAQVDKMWKAASAEVQEAYGRAHFSARADGMRKYVTGGITR